MVIMFISNLHAVAGFGCRTKLLLAGCRALQLSVGGRPLPLFCMNLPLVTPPVSFTICSNVYLYADMY